MISICCPSRSRPEFAARLCNNVKETACGKVEILFHIDNDDISFPRYQELCPEARLVRGERHVLGTLYNRLWKESCGDILMLTGDDIYFTTPNWDHEVERAVGLCPDRICFISGNKPSHFIGPVYIFVPRKVCDILGYLSPPWLNRWIDTWIWEIAQKLDRTVKVNMDIDHVHPSSGGRMPDQVMEELNRYLDNDARVFRDLAYVREYDANILKKKIFKEGHILM